LKRRAIPNCLADSFVEESNLSSNIAFIRKTLGDGENGLKFIETVPKRGYRFVAPVRELSRGVNEDAPVATFPGNAAPVEVAKPRRRFHPLLFVLLAAGLLIVGYYGIVRWFAARVSNFAPATSTAPFTTLPGSESQPTFAPDGNALAFAWNGELGNNVDIYVKQIGNEALLRLTTDPAEDVVPSWSRDGNWIYFSSKRSGSPQIWRMPAAGGAASIIIAPGTGVIGQWWSRASISPRRSSPNSR
jgi:hypothetical protein